MTMTVAIGKRVVPIFFHSIVAACCLWLAGCAGSGLFNTGADAPTFRDPALSMQNASDTIVIGKTTKAEVMAVLGVATVINFDSRFEVWVYRAKTREPAETNAEFVILFTPDGTVKKTRMRPAHFARN